MQTRGCPALFRSFDRVPGRASGVCGLVQPSKPWAGDVVQLPAGGNLLAGVAKAGRGGKRAMSLRAVTGPTAGGVTVSTAVSAGYAFPRSFQVGTPIVLDSASWLCSYLNGQGALRPYQRGHRRRVSRRDRSVLCEGRNFRTRRFRSTSNRPDATAM
jgi:hypothetical protein